MTPVEEFDFVIVGAGSAGCVLADRLSADGRNRVLVLEYGGSDSSVFIQMPSAFSIPMNMPKYDWGYWTEPEPGLGGRRIHQARGKVLGGSSSVNGMVYVRGHPGDFAEWEQLGATGWGYRHVLPYFKRAESCVYGEDPYRGGAGPLGTCNGNGMKNPLYRAFIDAGQAAGYPLTDDYNGLHQEGFGRMDMTVRDGVRCSAANAYLKPAMRRPNLAVETHALTTRVLFDGRRATGVEYRKGGKSVSVRATREVILSAGAFGTPQILMLSGVGPAAHLKDLGIAVQHELPGVGENLQDHLEVWIQQTCTQPISLAGKLNPISKALIGLRWLLFKDGLGATNHFESCGFIKSRSDAAYPDIQYHFLPAAMRYDGKASAAGHGFQVHVGHNKPNSRGRLRLRSTDAADKPSLLFNYLTDADDRAGFRAAVRLTRAIFAQPPFDPYRGAEIAPGPDIRSDSDVDDWVAATAETAYHPCGTCKMGSDPMSVVNPEGRVHGIIGLRVVDASVMPTVTNGNLNAPTIMIGEKISDAILGLDPLPLSNAPFDGAGASA
ncbi:MAG: choline dehydrogenase [Proteobacteria bacterium]|nr:choline dehydrogenase [Pseudomonadota bacterium]